MCETYTLNQLAMITGFTTRTLRNDLTLQLLSGEKQEGKWVFTAEQIGEYLQKPVVRHRLNAKQNAVVFDFLADALKKGRQLCVVLDVPASEDRLTELERFFCEQMNEAQNARFTCRKTGSVIRVTLAGAEESVSRILANYYGGKG